MTTLSEHRKLDIVEVKERMRKATLLDTSTDPPKVLKEFEGDIAVDAKKNIITTAWADRTLTVHVFNAEGKRIHEAIIFGCVDHYNVGKWIEVHTETGGGLYVYDNTASALRKLKPEERFNSES